MRLMKLKRFSRLNSAGDTIVEVLIVLAILSLAFSISSATANKGLSQSRNAEEHAQALGILKSQLEQLRTAITQNTTLPASGPFCMTSSNSTQSFSPPYSAVVGNAQGDTLQTPPYPALCTQDVYYSSIVLLPTSDTYELRVRWDGVGGLGRQQELMVYRIHNLTADTSSNIPLQPTARSIKVRVKKVPPTAPNTTPSCAAAATGDIGGSTVTLTQIGGPGTVQTRITDNSSIALFSNLTDTAPYKVDLTGVPSATAPGSYQTCPPTSVSVPGASGGQTIVDMKIRPICYVVHHHDYLGYYGDQIFDGYFGDQIYDGYYGDPYTIYWWNHESGARHPEWNTISYPFSTKPDVFYVNGGLGKYERFNSAGFPQYNTGGPYYNYYSLQSGIAFTAPYDHYHTGPPYNHYHTGPPYDHYNDYDQNVCPP
jgi:type II secretory pathway pseudopilin PulG